MSGRKDFAKFVKFVLKIPRYWLVLTLTPDIYLELDIQTSLSEFTVNQSPLSLVFSSAITTFQYTNSLPDIDSLLFMDFKITLPFSPTWISPYSSVGTGCACGFLVTMTVDDSK